MTDFEILMQATQNLYPFRRDKLVGRGRTSQPLALLRRVMAYVGYHTMGMRYAEIAAGMEQHLTSVSYGIRKIDKEVKTNKKVLDMVNLLTEEVLVVAYRSESSDREAEKTPTVTR